MREILVVRKYDDFSRILANDGFSVINLPLIETTPILDLSELEAKLDAIENYDGVFLTSAAAAEIFRTKSVERAAKFRGKIYVLGKRSFEILKSANLDLFFDETINSARDLMKKIAPENLSNKRFLFVRGDKSLRTVPDFLAKKATVDETIVYDTRAVAIEADELKTLREKFENKTITAACFFSPSAGNSFIEQFGAAILHQTIIATIGKTTAEFFERRNIPVGFVSSKASAEDFAVELAENLEKKFSHRWTRIEAG